MTDEEIASVCHAANRALQAIQADPGIPVASPWPDFAEQEPVISGVNLARAGATPEELHNAWCAAKIKDGWRYGEVKDAEAKTHPCLVRYAELPEAQKLKDRLFQAIVSALG